MNRKVWTRRGRETGTGSVPEGFIVSTEISFSSSDSEDDSLSLIFSSSHNMFSNLWFSLIHHTGCIFLKKNYLFLNLILEKNEVDDDTWTCQISIFG